MTTLVPGVARAGLASGATPDAPLSVETTTDRASYSWFGTITVTADVRLDGTPVPDCDSVVVVSSANPDVRSRLADDGIFPDVTSGDGRYTGYFDIGAGRGEARPAGSYTVTATAYRGAESASDASPLFSLYTVRRWTGITTVNLPDPYDVYTSFVVTSNGPGAGWRHRIADFGLVRSVAATDAQIRIPILPQGNAISGVTVTGGGNPSGVRVRDNVIEFTCNLSASAVTRVTLEFDAPSDLAATLIDRYHTADIGQRNFRNGYMIWNELIHTGILGSDYSSPHGPGCIVDLHVTDLETGAPHTVDCMERVAVHLDDAAFNDGTGTYPSNIKWTGDALSWLQSGDLQSMDFRFESGGLYGLRNKVAVMRTVEFFAGSRLFRHRYVVRNIDSVPHDFDFVWGREQWLYGSAPGSDRHHGDRGMLPNDEAAYGGEYRFNAQQIDGNWIAAFDLSSNYSIGVVLADRSAAAMPTWAYFLCNPALGNFTGEYPILPAGSCADMANIFFEKRLGVLAPGDSAAYEFYQWGGYGRDREALTAQLWRDAAGVSGEPLAYDVAPLGDDVPVSSTIDLRFTNPMDRATTQAAFRITPAAPGGGAWEWSEGDRHLRFRPAQFLSGGTIYHVEVDRSALDAEGRPLATAASWYFETSTGTSDAPLAAQVREGAVLGAAAPNPFTTSTDIDFELPASGPARLSVYNARGQLVALLVDGVLASGRHVVNWRGDDGRGRSLSGGVYFYRLEAAGTREVRKVVIAKGD